MTHTEEWIRSWKPPKIKHGVPTRWGWVVLYPKRLQLGKCVDIGQDVFIQAEAGVEIGDYCEVGAGTKIYSVSTIDGKRGSVIIMEKACVGANSVVLPGVVIGQGAVVGALSLVNRDVQPGAVVGGIPARLIGQKTR